MIARMSLVKAVVLSAILSGCMDKKSAAVANCKQSLLTPDIKTAISLFDERDVTLSGKLEVRSYVAPPGSYDMALISNLGDYGIQEEAGGTLIEGFFLTGISEACLTEDELKVVELSRPLPQGFNDSSVTITGAWWRSAFGSRIIIDPASVTLASGSVINSESQRYSHLGKPEPRVVAASQSGETLSNYEKEQLMDEQQQACQLNPIACPDVCPPGPVADCFKRCYKKDALTAIIERSLALERVGRRMSIERAMEIAIGRKCPTSIIPTEWFSF